MATKRKGSNKYRSMRNGAAHSVENCDICAGRTCRVKVASPTDGEFVAQLVPLDNGRTRLDSAGASLPRLGAGREIELNGTAPRPAGWEPERWSEETLRAIRRLPIHIPCATALAMQHLLTWGASHARL
jgi:hypothetical protein